MAAEVNMRECQSQIETELRGTSRAGKSPWKGKPLSRTSGATEHGRLEDAKAVTKTSVLQGKVKALKQKHKEFWAIEYNREDRDSIEDALVIPQLRTYLTEDALESNSPMRFPDTTQETLSSEDPWGVCRTEDAVKQNCNGNFSMTLSDVNLKTTDTKPRIWPENPHQTSFHLDVSPCTNNLSLAERVERNRQELRSRFNQATSYSSERVHGDGDDHTQSSKEGHWMLQSDVDGDSGVSLAVSENYRELSVRHEQAKQLLHRARMKAKGASPLRASHCVISQPHLQPPLRRSPGISCTTTDGGSLSDSSSSDYCSGQRGSRGSSPSHVRFQDESERDVEERYRERQQHGPQALGATTTPPVKRHSNGNMSWTQHVLPSEQCGTSSSHQNGSGVGQLPGSTTQGSSSRNIQLGSRIVQEAPLSYTSGTRPSPHWILPSQPWRIHSELIRETHIGGDSTADSSGEDEGNRSQSKNSPSFAIRPNFRNKPPNTFPKPGSNANSSNQEDENGGNVYGAYKKQYPPPSKPNPKNKIPENNIETQAVPKSCPLDASIKSMIHPMPQNAIGKAEVRSVNAGLEYRRDLNPDIGTGDILVNLETTAGRKRHMPEDIKAQSVPTVPHSKQTIPPLDVDSVEGNLSFSGRVPMPPAGRAPTTVPSRANRFTTRLEETIPQLSLSNSPEVSLVQLQEKRKNTLPKSTQNNQETAEDRQMFSQTGAKAKEHRTKERHHRSKKAVDNEMPNNVKDHRSQGRTHVPSEQAERQRPHLIKRHSDREHPHSNREQSEIKEPMNRTMSNSSGQHPTNDRHNATGEEKHTEKGGTQRQQHCINNTNKGDNMCQSINQENSIQEKHRLQEQGIERAKAVPMMPQSQVQSSLKKSDIRSGMKKIFSTFGLTSRPKMDRFQSSSLEQISRDRDSATDGDGDSYKGTFKPSGIKKSPSLQSLKLMSPFHLPRKASSVQNLLGKSDRSVVYVTGDNNTAPRRALSVEDIGSPDMPRSVGRVSKVYPDGTRLLELQRPSQGNFGFTISSGNGRPDSGVYVQEMTDASTAKLYSGLLRVGDEILELNGTKVSILGHGQLNEMMTHEPVLSLRVLHQRRTKC